jgi:ABC-type lipoprotein export system ATPase subunit
VLALLSELNREFQKAIVLVTHDPRALGWVQDILHIDKGRLLEGDEATRATQSLEQALGVGRRSAGRP